MKRRGRPVNVLEPELFERRTAVDSETGCMEWTGYRQSLGYGQVELGGKLWLAHRAAWKLFRGPIPEGLLVLHKCDNPACCNIEHLFLGTHKDNTRDAIAKGRHPGRVPAWGVRKSRVVKLTDAQVRQIRMASGKDAEIAARFGVSRSTICDIRNLRRKTLVTD